MSGKKSRSLGCRFEREIAQIFREHGYEHVKTSRSASRFADDCKIDLVNVGEFAIQCKRSVKNWPSINELFKVEHEEYARHLMASLLIGIDTGPDLEDPVLELTPMLITKINNKDTVAVLKLQDLMRYIPSPQ